MKHGEFQDWLKQQEQPIKILLGRIKKKLRKCKLDIVGGQQTREQWFPEVLSRYSMRGILEDAIHTQSRQTYHIIQPSSRMVQTHPVGGKTLLFKQIVGMLVAESLHMHYEELREHELPKNVLGDIILRPEVIERHFLRITTALG